MDRTDLFEQFHALRRSLVLIFAELPEEDWRPRDDMRSLWEVANHLAQVPSIDTLIARGMDEATVHRAQEVAAVRSTEALLTQWDRGVTELEAFYGGLTEAEFEEQLGTAFYGHSAAFKTWLLETVTHCHHHRAQLFNYLREFGLPLNGFAYLYA